MVKKMDTSASMEASSMAMKKGVAQRCGVDGPLVMTMTTVLASWSI